MLRLETSADGAIGDIRNAIGDNGGVIDERHVGKHGHKPADTVEVLREEHTGDDAVVAFGVLDLKRILEHKASGRDGEGEAHSNLQNGTQLRTSLFTAGTTAGHATTAAAVTWPVVVQHSTTQPVRSAARTPHAVAAVDRIIQGRPHQLRVPQVGQTLPRLIQVHFLRRRHRCKALKSAASALSLSLSPSPTQTHTNKCFF